MDVRYAFAAAAEAGRIGDDPRALVLGVGKATAAATLAASLTRCRPAAIVLCGVAGAYPSSRRLAVGDLGVVVEDCFADEGALTPDGFRTLADLGLTDEIAWTSDPRLTERVAAALGDLPRLRGATVSTCSGTDDLATTIAARTDADIETMEGAAVAMVCARFGVPWAALRCISNRTGDRDRGGWDLPRATANLQAAVRKLLETPWWS